MQISIIVVMGERRTFDLSEVGPCYADDDVIYFANIPCVLSSAEPAQPVKLNPRCTCYLDDTPDAPADWHWETCPEYAPAPAQAWCNCGMGDGTMPELHSEWCDVHKPAPAGGEAQP